MRIGIMGGTFDPPHLGHILPVREAARQFDLQQVWFVPNSVPPHKVRPDLTDSHHRAAMVALAIQHDPNFLLNLHELRRSGPTYTFDTISDFRNGPARGHRLFFILGTDSFLEIDTWYRYAELLTLCEFIMINRGDLEEELQRNLRRLENTLQRNLEATFHFCRSNHIPVSSTQVREALQQGRSIADLVPREVEAYVVKHSLYTRRDEPSD